jgi:hypothetical protein
VGETVPSVVADMRNAAGADATDVARTQAANASPAKAADVASAEAAHMAASAEAAHMAASAKAAHMAAAKTAAHVAAAATAMAATAAAATRLGTSSHQAAGEHCARQDHYRSSSHDILLCKWADYPPQVFADAGHVASGNANAVMD